MGPVMNRRRHKFGIKRALLFIRPTVTFPAADHPAIGSRTEFVAMLNHDE